MAFWSAATISGRHGVGDETHRDKEPNDGSADIAEAGHV